MPKIIDEKYNPAEVRRLLKVKGIRQVDIVKDLDKTKQQVSRALTSEAHPGLLKQIVEYYELKSLTE